MWKTIEDFPLYEITENGVIRNKETKQIRKQYLNKDGYYTIGLSKGNQIKTVQVHRLIAKTYLERSENATEVDHIDKNRTNNCLENLRWVTHNENMKNQNNSFGMVKAIQNIETQEIFYSITEAANKYHIAKQNISAVLKGKRKTCGGYHWQYIN